MPMLKGTKKVYSFLLQETQEMKRMAFKTDKFCMVVIKKDFSRTPLNNVLKRLGEQICINTVYITL